MNTIELLEHALEIAEMAKLRVRLEWLDGGAGGLCRIGKQHWLFVDVSLSADEQLAQVTAGLRSLNLLGMTMKPDLERLLVAGTPL